MAVQEVWHRDGIPWNDRPKPRRWFHRHRADSFGRDIKGVLTMRCACGAFRWSDIPGWTKRER